MPRTQHFLAHHVPPRDDLALRHTSIRGPLPFLHPTRVRYDFKQQRPGEDEDPTRKVNLDPLTQGCSVEWNSRDNRKGRHTLVVPRHAPLAAGIEPSTSVHAVLLGIWRMLTVYAYWDISWWIAVLFTIGCLLFILSGLFAWLPVAYPSTTFPGEETAGLALSFVGATLFQLGGIGLVFEAFNANRTGCFGWALEETFAGDDLTASAIHHRCHHVQKHGTAHHDPRSPSRDWQWWPTWTEITTHYIYEIGFWASITMAVGATVFWVSGILSCPGLYELLSDGVLLGVYWMTYLVGGCIFVLSSLLYVLETQPNWYTPAPGVLGWHIGVWNLIGSVGWVCSASFGYCAEVAADPYYCTYQSDLSLTWASVAFTIGSALLWYEALDKYPVVIEKKALKTPDTDSESGPESS